MFSFKSTMPVVLVLLLSSCVSIADINFSSQKIETAWLLDYQKMEMTHRTRVVESAASDTFLHVKRALVDIDLPIISSDMVAGTIVARGIAPSPLSAEEWNSVVLHEGPRVRQLSDGILYLNKDPSDYVLTVNVLVRGNSQKSIVVLDYQLNAPKYEALGIQMPRVAPPQAVLVGTEKFWEALSSRLKKASMPKPRKMLSGETV